MKATTSSLAKRCDTESAPEVDSQQQQQATAVDSASSSVSASLSWRISKLVKGRGSKRAVAATTSTAPGKRLSLDAGARPPPPRPVGPTTSVTSRPGSVTSRPRDVTSSRDSGDRKSTSELSRSLNVGQGGAAARPASGGGASAAAARRGGGETGRTRVPPPGPPRRDRPAAAALVKSSSTMSLRTEAVRKNSAVKSLSVYLSFSRVTASRLLLQEV